MAGDCGGIAMMRCSYPTSIIRAAAYALFVVAMTLPRPAEAQRDSTGTGYLKLVTNRDTVLVVLDDRFDAFRRVPAGDSLIVSAGRHRVIVAARGVPDYVFDVDITADETVEQAVWRGGQPFTRSTYLEHSSYPALTERLNLKVYTDADADILIDGEWAGRGTAFRMLPEGEYLVTAVHAHAGARHRAVWITGAPPRLQEFELFTKPVRHIAGALSLIPGAAQWYKGERRKAIGAAVLISAAVTLAYSRHHTFTSNQAKFIELRETYERTTDETIALRLGDEAEAMHARVRSDASARDLLMGISLGLYAINIGDGLRKPRGGFREGRPIHVRLGSASGSNQPELRFQYTF